VGLRLREQAEEDVKRMERAQSVIVGRQRSLFG
jgi:hypothetical protein